MTDPSKSEDQPRPGGYCYDPTHDDDCECGADPDSTADAHTLIQAATRAEREGDDISADLHDGVTAITNAHSWLNNGQLESLISNAKRD